MADAMRGRVCLVTGATRGLGRETARGLAATGATVVLLVRDVDAGKRVAGELARDTGSSAISVAHLDLASLASVRATAAELAARHAAVHVLVNNAGVNVSRRRLSTDGFELTLAVNHLGPFLLTNLLFPLLRAATDARVVTVTSWFERFGRIDVRDLALERWYTAFRAYARSKLANVLFTYELAERWRDAGISANCIHPGLVATDLMRELPRWMRGAYEPLLARPSAAAAPIVRLAADAELRGVTGRYFDRLRIARSSARSRDPDLRRRLWDVSEQLVGLGS